jgi:hypothetical protein
MIFDLRPWGRLGRRKSKITTEEADALRFRITHGLMILDLSLLFGIKSKITTASVRRQKPRGDDLGLAVGRGR